MGDQLKGLLVNLVLGGLIAMLLFGVVRRLPRTWWIWGSIVSILFVMFTVLIAPVYIFPIFNKITRIDDPRITGPILSLARANGIPANDVYEIDASRQTTRMSANVSGLGSTTRITLNDNLLKRGSPEEIQFRDEPRNGSLRSAPYRQGHAVFASRYCDYFWISALVTELDIGPLG